MALGDLYAHDIDAGIISESEALEWILCLWRLFTETGEAAVCRIVVGGMGRRNEANADRFAMAAMEATRRHRKVTPQLTLRLYKGQNAKLLDKAMQALGEGTTYPMLYNDDVVVPGIARALNVSTEVANLYHPMGCGEYMLAHCSPSILVYVWSVPKSDGRLKGQPFAIGHAPTAGQDRSGLTALFNSVAKVDADSGGATTNFKLSPEWFKGAKSQAETMFRVYFGKGGQEATITVVNRDDLEAALKEPEKYPHVLVRLGGWSARFIDLEKNVQMEILERTQY